MFNSQHKAKNIIEILSAHFLNHLAAVVIIVLIVAGAAATLASEHLIVFICVLVVVCARALFA